MSYQTLFSPINIGAMQLPNRVVMSPMTTDYGTSDQEPSERLLAYLEARARGGVGLITLEVCSVALDHRYQVNSLSLSEDRFVKLHRSLVNTVHQHGAKIQPQITHPGPESLAIFFEGKPGVGPSVNVNPAALQSSRSLELSEIPGIIDQYVAASVRAKHAGYDGMELHAAHAYMLLGSFLSPLRNNRNDDYGGKRLQGRARLLIETLTAIKAAVGADFPITVSISGYERSPGGREINESQRLAQMLEEAGANALRVSGGTTDRLVSQMVMGSDYPFAANATAAESIRQAVSIPVMVVGRIHTPQQAERILSTGQADLVAMGRPFLADPEWPQKAKEGRASEIRRCISCENCIDSMIDQQNLSCAVNAATGREATQHLASTERPKKVVVIGAGPAGMEAARVADLKGHKVTLIERQKRLGGSLLLASTVHSDNQFFFDWIRAQIDSSGIDLRLGQEATIELINELSPDAIVVATGARVDTPTIKGDDQSHVFNGAQMRRMVEGTALSTDFNFLPAALSGVARTFLRLASAFLTPGMMRTATKWWLPFGKTVVVIGADLAALELAEFLAKRGRKVSIIDSSKRIAREIGPKRLAEHMDRLDKLGVTINTEIDCEAIEFDLVHYRTAGGHSKQIKADSVIIAGDPVADQRITESLETLAPEVFSIGDCTGLGLIRKATNDGMRVACQL